MKTNDAAEIDFEKFGFATMMQVQDAEHATKICALHVGALAARVNVKVAERRRALAEVKGRIESLCTQLYESEGGAVSDIDMLGRKAVVFILAILTTVSFAASMALHAWMFIMLGVGVILSTILGAALSAATAAAGHVALEALLAERVVKSMLGVLALVAVLAGLWQFGEVRGQISGEMISSQTSESAFVESEPLPDEDGIEAMAGPEARSLEQRVVALLSSASKLITFAIDVSLATLMAMFTSMWSTPSFRSWRRLEILKKAEQAIHSEMDRSSAIADIAWKNALAGIARGARTPRSIPYYKVLPAILLLAILPHEANAQQIRRHEIIIVDLSASIGTRPDAFREYLQGTRQLLMSLPPQSRVWVTSIGADSFGGQLVTLVRGRTPNASGVLTDSLNKSRRQLTDAFDRKIKELTPSASGSDIVGALAYARASIESARTEGQPSGEVIVTLFSDMHDTRFLDPSVLRARGVQAALRRAREERALVQMNGWKVRVLGAGTQSLDPSGWHALRSFWTGFIEAGGGRLIQYSVDATVQR